MSRCRFSLSVHDIIARLTPIRIHQVKLSEIKFINILSDRAEICYRLRRCKCLEVCRFTPFDVVWW